MQHSTMAGTISHRLLACNMLMRMQQQFCSTPAAAGRAGGPCCRMAWSGTSASARSGGAAARPGCPCGSGRRHCPAAPAGAARHPAPTPDAAWPGHQAVAGSGPWAAAAHAGAATAPGGRRHQVGAGRLMWHCQAPGRRARSAAGSGAAAGVSVALGTAVQCCCRRLLLHHHPSSAAARPAQVDPAGPVTCSCDPVNCHAPTLQDAAACRVYQPNDVNNEAQRLLHLIIDSRRV